MAATTEQIAALENALYSGELTVKYGDRLVTYRSIPELQRALALARGETGPQRVYMSFSRDGWE